MSEKISKPNYVLDTSPILQANIFFSLISLILSLCTIRIFLTLKNLRTLTYRLFFYMAVNESINRLFYIFQYITFIITEKYNDNLIYKISNILIFFTDNNILICLTILCFSISDLILKQRKFIAQFYRQSIILGTITSALFTMTHFIQLFLTHNFTTDFYSNILSSYFTFEREDELNHTNTLISKIKFIIMLFLYSGMVIFSVYNIFKIRNFIKTKNEEVEILEEEKNRQKKLKLQTFAHKMYMYPFLGVVWVVPLLLYSSTILFGSKKNSSLIAQQFKLFCFGLNCFANSIRGILYFKGFISNDKIKIYIENKLMKYNFYRNIVKIRDFNKEIKPKKEKKTDNKSSLNSTSIIPLIKDDSQEISKDSNSAIEFKVKDSNNNSFDENKNNDEDKEVLDSDENWKEKNY